MPLGVPEKLGKDEVKADSRSHETGPVPQTEGLNDKFGCFKWDILRLAMSSADRVFY